MEEKDHLSVTDYSGGDSVTLDISGYGAAQPTMNYSYAGSGTDTIDLGNFSIDTNTITIGNGTSSSWTTTSSGFTSVQYAPSTRATISTGKNTVDIDELAELIKVLKERMLIIVPNFEMHEKYPMLKEMYDEYKAMEKLLSGPDRGLDSDE